MHSVTDQALVRALWRFVGLRSAWRRSFAMEPPRTLDEEPAQQQPSAPRHGHPTGHCPCRS